MLASLVMMLAAAAPAAGAAAWETYACTDGPSVTLALVGGRPAEAGFLATEAGTVALTRHAGEADGVLRGGGYMVRPFNWLDILYAPPGRETNAYTCRVAGAAERPGAPVLE